MSRPCHRTGWLRSLRMFVVGLFALPLCCLILPSAGSNICGVPCVIVVSMRGDHLNVSEIDVNHASETRYVAMRTWIGMVVGLLAIMGLGLAQTVYAYELVNKDSYRLAVGEVVDNDLYIAAETITIDGTVRGDLVAMARVIEINGTVEGDLMAAAGSIIINGTIRDDVRVGANGIRIAGSIGDDFIAAFGGGDAMTQMPFDTGPAMSGLALTTDGQVGGSLLLFGGAADLLGRVQGDVQAGVGVLTLAGKVAGDVQAHVNELRVADNARVAGALAYTAEREMPTRPAVLRAV